MDLGWVRDLIGQCREAGTAVFVKQLGSRWARGKGGDSHGGDMDLWPEELRIREFPRVAEMTGAA
jgi:protein gp37